MGVGLTKEFPLLPLENIAKKAGKEEGADRVSASAVEELRSVLLEQSYAIGRDAVELARHAKRVTVRRDDIKLAARK